MAVSDINIASGAFLAANRAKRRLGAGFDPISRESSGSLQGVTRESTGFFSLLQGATKAVGVSGR